MIQEKPKDLQQLLNQGGACANRDEYFARTRFKSPWQFVEAPQERPKPLIQMETFDRNNMFYEAIAKRNKEEALAEACEDESPDLRMGERQVYAK